MLRFVQVFGHILANPIGTSAGIDKHAAIPSPLFHLGPSIVEIGGVRRIRRMGMRNHAFFACPRKMLL